MSKPHPCLSCGACCASFRVSFYWAEIDNDPKVPEEKTEKLNDFYACMKGTNEVKPRCVALGGELGKEVACSVYENRPTPCREFTASYEDGKRNERCDQAREKIGLRPLTGTDY